MGDVGIYRDKRMIVRMAGHDHQKTACPCEIIRFRSQKGAPEAEADGLGGMMGADVSDTAALGRAMDRAVVLRIEEVEQAGDKNEREAEGRGLFHVPAIIP